MPPIHLLVEWRGWVMQSLKPSGSQVPSAEKYASELCKNKHIDYKLQCILLRSCQHTWTNNTFIWICLFCSNSLSSTIQHLPGGYFSPFLSNPDSVWQISLLCSFSFVMEQMKIQLQISWVGQSTRFRHTACLVSNSLSFRNSILDQFWNK